MKISTLLLALPLATLGTTATAEARTSARNREVCGAPNGLNFRSAPSMHARVRGTLPAGQNLTMLGISGNGRWLRVKNDGNGRTGFVSRQFTCRRGESPNRGRGGAREGVGGIARWRNPVQGTCVTSDFGPRRRPCSTCSNNHHGTDLGAGCGTPIKSAAPGRVIFSGWMGAYGNAIMIRHPNGVVSLYGHMSRRNLGPGNVVGRNEIIGRVGTTGASTGCHLHFEVRRGGRAFNPQSLIGFGRCPTYGKSTGSRFLQP